MKAIVLAGGFGTRLLPLTRDIPKALLRVAGIPIIDFQMAQLTNVAEIDEIIVTTNSYFESQFRQWWSGLPEHTRKMTALIVEPARREEEKFGAVKATHSIIEERGLTGDDILIIAGDNIFEFDFLELVVFYKNCHKPVVVGVNLTLDEIKGKYGVICVDETGRVKSFEEKPDKPTSTLASTGCYLYPPVIKDFLREYVNTGDSLDAPGHFIKWLHCRTDVYAFVTTTRWHDIGSFESYEEANRYYSQKFAVTSIESK